MEKKILKSEAVAAYGGNQAALAKALGISRQAVHKAPEGPVHESWELKLRYKLRPDLFGPNVGAEQKAA
ncbi:MAG TPA: helix-turn-helix domain-containing protein [Dokdonella sp.]|nr:helix-turn-helix domain-containing protein [Dokdonella sp.]